MHRILVMITLLSSILPQNLDFGQSIYLQEKIYDDYQEKANNVDIAKDEFNISIPDKPQKHSNTPLNYLTSKAALAIDIKSSKVLFEKNIDEKLQIASLTKLMTAYVVLKENNLNEIATVPILNVGPEDSLMGLREGETITVESALNGLLINSGNDSAQTLAIHNAGSIDKFVEKMNIYAEKLNLDNTHYSNPVGWDSPDNYSTVSDTISLSRVLIRNTTFSEIVRSQTKTVYTTNGRLIHLTNTNKLLDGTNYLGIKTGYTLGAGECLVTVIKQNDKEIMTALIGSNNRFLETRSLKEWIYTVYSW